MAAVNKGGQPTKYRPEYCEKVVQWGKEGKSIAQMCAELGVVYNTVTANWPRQNPEFAEALDLWYIHALAFWEAKVETNLNNREFQAHLYLRSMSARFPEHWRETNRTELTGKDGERLMQPRPDLEDLNDEQLEAIATLKLKRGDGDEVRH